MEIPYAAQVECARRAQAWDELTGGDKSFVDYAKKVYQYEPLTVEHYDHEI